MDADLRGLDVSPYSERDIISLDRAGNYYCRHVAAMTKFALHAKSDIAAELAWRDSRIATLEAALAVAQGQGFVMVPMVPTDGLLMSMAIRSDHALGCPGYYDQPIFGGEGVGHAKQLAATLSEMRKLHEEVVGDGFYKPEKDAQYVAMLAAALAQPDGVRK